MLPPMPRMLQGMYLYPSAPKVLEELKHMDSMESMGVIQRVSEPTPWCAGMVVVPKRSGLLELVWI